MNTHATHGHMSLDDLKKRVHAPKITRNDQLLHLLSFNDNAPKSIADLRRLAADAGVRGHKSWKISSTLSSVKKKVMRTPHGWELNPTGKQYIHELSAPSEEAPPEPLISLRRHAASIGNSTTREFVEEAIACCESGLYRAAVVLAWVGAVSLLYEHVLVDHLKEFNQACEKRDPKWRTAKTVDGLARLKEADFLLILESISVIGKSTKQELEGCLTLRNGCGHPNTLKVSKQRVLAHIESLVDNVYSRFSRSAA